MSYWQKIKLGDAPLKIIDGDRGINYPKKDDFKDHGYCLFLNTSNVTIQGFNFDGLDFISKEKDEALSKGKLNRGDIILTTRGTVGNIALFNDSIKFDHIRINSGMVIIRVEPKKIDPEFLLYFFKSNLFKTQVISQGSGSAQPQLPISSLKDIYFPNKEIFTQQKIAKVLSDLDAKIKLNNRINAELEAMAKLVYEYWFVQFDFPFDHAQGKPDKNGKPYKSSGGKMVWNEELKREIPEGWEVHPVDYWIQNDKNGDWGKEEIEGNYDLRVSCIRGADINGLNGNGELKSPVRYILDKNSHKILEPGDLVIEISGGSPTQSTGRLGYIINETLERFSEPLICSNFCKAITLKEESNLFNFIYEWKRLYDAGIFFGYEGKTSGIKNFLFESFVSKHKIVIPPQELTEKFYEKVLPIHSKIQKNLRQNQELSTLRDWLLPMLMNGQVRLDGLGDLVVKEELGMVAERNIYNINPK